MVIKIHTKSEKYTIKGEYFILKNGRKTEEHTYKKHNKTAKLNVGKPGKQP